MVPSPLAGEGQGEGVTNSLQNSIRLVSHWMILNTGSWAAMMSAFALAISGQCRMRGQA